MTLPILGEQVETDPLQILTARWTRSHATDLAVLAVTGEIDAATIRLLEQRLWQDPSPGVIVDLGEVTFMSAAAIRCLVRATERGISERRRFGIVVSTRPVKRVLTLTGADAVLPLFSTLYDAARELVPVHCAAEGAHR